MAIWEIEQHVRPLKYRVRAATAAEAILRLLDKTLDGNDEVMGEGPDADYRHGIPVASCHDLESELLALGIQVRGVIPSIARIQQVFVASLYFRNDQGALHLLASDEVCAQSRQAAEKILLDCHWDNRLDAASCIPHFEFEE